MEIEIQGIPQSLRASYQARLRGAKSELTRYKRLLTETKSQTNRYELLPTRVGSPYVSADEPYESGSDRARLLSGTMMLEDGTKRLQESQRLALETENQGSEILRNLRGQRDQIEHARETVSIVVTIIGPSSGSVR